MSPVVFLDAGPLGMVINPMAEVRNDACNRWMVELLTRGFSVVVPEIADYEVRRELVRAKRTQALTRLDSLKTTITYCPLTTDAMLKAAEFWAHVRNIGKPTADDKELDGDVILAAQAEVHARLAGDVVIATANVRHLSLIANARLWNEIR